MRALKGEADIENVGVMTFSDIARFVRVRVQEEAARSGHRQDPHFEKLSLVGNGEMLFFGGGRLGMGER